jgi:NitT/TauT family transport system permease protein
MTFKIASNTSADSYSESPLSPERKARQAIVLLAQSAAVPVLSLIALFLIWEGVVVFFDLPVYLLPAPSVIWEASLEKPGTLLGHTVVTLRTVLLGFFASVLISLPLAVVITSSQWLANVIYPLLVLTQSIPKVALAPILVIALGANELTRTVVTFLVAFFPLVIAVATGLMTAPKELIELGRSYRGSAWQIIVRIKLPYAIPMIFSGLKVAVTLSVVGAVVAEFVNADAGLGYYIVTSTAFFETPLAFSALIILSFMGVLLFQLVCILERRLFPWSAGAGGQLIA